MASLDSILNARSRTGGSPREMRQNGATIDEIARTFGLTPLEANQLASAPGLIGAMPADMAGLQWNAGTNGWPEMFAQPPAQPQGLLDMVAGPQNAGGPAPEQTGLLGMLGRSSPASMMQPGMLGRVSGLPASAAPVPRARPIKPDTYKAVRGDNLTKIAHDHGLTLKQLAALNPDIRNLNKIKIGQVIRLA